MKIIITKQKRQLFLGLRRGADRQCLRRYSQNQTQRMENMNDENKIPHSWTDSYGYQICRFRGKDRKLHRVLWFLHYGQWPIGNLDHINRDKQDNRIENLRESNPLIDARNQDTRKDNTSGLRGVNWRADCSRWAARIGVNGKRVCLGHSRSLFEAACLRKAAELQENYHKSHGEKYE